MHGAAFGAPSLEAASLAPSGGGGSLRIVATSGASSGCDAAFSGDTFGSGGGCWVRMSFVGLVLFQPLWGLALVASSSGFVSDLRGDRFSCTTGL